MECISWLSQLWEQHGLFHRRIGEQELLPQYFLDGDGDENVVEFGNILLIHEDPNFFPGDGIGKWQDDVVGYDDWDAAEDDGLDQPRAPRCPS